MRSIRKIAVLLASLFLAECALATTYYIAANGSDANSGTSKSSPWLHAPGMQGCSGTCAATTPRAGDQFILRGGDVWHTSSGTPIGLPWSWRQSGTSGSPIYIGVDQTWYAGSSWSRPVLSMDNPPSTSPVSSCTFADDSMVAVNLSASYVTFDNFEFTGYCWTGTPSTSYVGHGSGSNITLSNLYFHGWTHTNGAIDNVWMIRGNTSPISITDSVFDGWDSHCSGTSAGNCSGAAIYTQCTNVVRNYFHRVSNVFICVAQNVHDNLVENSYQTYDGQTHGNIFEWLAGSSNALIYNNIIRHIDQGVTLWPMTATNYHFNNVFYDIGNAANCTMQSPASVGASGKTYLYNNTFDSPCPARFYGGNQYTPGWQGPAYFENNHYIGFSTFSSTYTVDSGANVTINNSGGHVFQTETAANGQGYSPSNGYAPTSSTDATVGAGNNLTSWCGSIPDSNAASACTKGISSFSYDSTKHVFKVTAGTARPSTGSWDAGAYQFGSASAGVNPPTNLQATVQ